MGRKDEIQNIRDCFNWKVSVSGAGEGVVILAQGTFNA